MFLCIMMKNLQLMILNDSLYACLPFKSLPGWWLILIKIEGKDKNKEKMNTSNSQQEKT